MTPRRFLRPPRFADHREHLAALRAAALRAVDPADAVRRNLSVDDLAGAERVFLVGAGKAGVAMALAAAEIAGERLSAGIIAVPRGSRPSGGLPIEFVEGGHPTPDAGSVRAGQLVAKLLAQTTERDLVIALISGGGSALLELPRPGLTLSDLQMTNNQLLRCGAAIREINTVRGTLSQIKRGGLARLAYPARVLGLILSDVVGNPLDIIASGPTVPSPVSPSEALAVLEKYGLTARVPNAVLNHLRLSVSQPPITGHPSPIENRLIASNRLAGEAAAAAARELGFDAVFLSDDWQGEAREVGKRFAELITSPPSPALRATPPPSPKGREGRGRGWGVRAFVAGGESTVTVRGGGAGGRNQEVALAAALAIEGRPGRVISTFATDGVDGPTDAAGATVTGNTVARARALGLDPQKCLDDNDAYTFFAALGDLVITGPTGTNVNDLIFGLVYASI